MSEESLQRKVFSGLFWKFGERIGAQLVSFVVRIVLARLLSPSDFGVIVLITVFIDIANVFVSSGFGSALNPEKRGGSTGFFLCILFQHCNVVDILCDCIFGSASGCVLLRKRYFVSGPACTGT